MVAPQGPQELLPTDTEDEVAGSNPVAAILEQAPPGQCFFVISQPSLPVSASEQPAIDPCRRKVPPARLL